MTNLDRAADIIEYLTDEPHLYPDGGLPDAAAQALEDNGLLAPDPQIIRTREELAALDPETVLMSADMGSPLSLVWHWIDSEGNPFHDAEDALPAVAITTGYQVRAARQALKEEE